MAHRHGDPGVAQIDRKGPWHAVIKAEGSIGDEWYPLCQCESEYQAFPSVGRDQLVEGPVTCRDCKRTYRLLGRIMEGK